MKMEWDELSMLSSFVQDRPEEWRAHVERHGFEIQVAQAILARFLKMTQDEERAYVERFGERKPAMKKAVMQVTKGEQTFDIELEYNKMDGWYVSRVPGKIAFVLLAKTLESAQTRLTDRGWKWQIIGDTDEP